MPDFKKDAQAWLDNIDFAANSADSVEKTEIARDVWLDIRPMLAAPLAHLLEKRYDDGYHDGYCDCRMEE